MSESNLKSVEPTPIRGVQFGTILKDRKGEEITNLPNLAPASIEQLASQVDFPTLQKALRDLVEQSKEAMTLAKACEIALDQTLEMDKGDGVKKIIHRANLIDSIHEAANDLKPLQLKAEDTALIKKRVGEVFRTASVVKAICTLLDPASKED